LGSTEKPSRPHQGADKGDVIRRIWRKTRRFGRATRRTKDHQERAWLAPVPDMMIGVEDDLISPLRTARALAQIQNVMLCGMGVSLCRSLSADFGHQDGYPELLVLDSTDQDAFGDIADQIDIGKCLFIISSKSALRSSRSSSINTGTTKWESVDQIW